MPTEGDVEFAVVPAPTDHVRIVPLYVPEHVNAAPAGPPPKLTYRNGPLLGAVQVFTVEGLRLVTGTLAGPEAWLHTPDGHVRPMDLGDWCSSRREGSRFRWGPARIGA